MSLPTSGSLIGKKLGAYRIEALLGSGGMGDVYRGVHEILGRPVAIKTLKPEIAADRSALKRFFDEAQAVNRIRHENLVEVTDLIPDLDGYSYMVMELLDGRTLTEAIRQAGRLPAERAVRIAAQIAGAIHAAHEKGIIHRDLKPDNVFLIRRAGTADYVKILDFGIARLRPELGGIGATKTGTLIGTPAYMSPEQAEGTVVTNASDIYSLGVILFHMLTGRLPFPGPSMPEVMFGHVALEPPSVQELSPDVPRALAEVVKHALAKKPAERPPSMAAMRRRLLASVGMEVTDVEDEDSAPPRPAAVDSRASSMWSGPTVDATGKLSPEGPRVQATHPAHPAAMHSPASAVTPGSSGSGPSGIMDSSIEATPPPAHASPHAPGPRTAAVEPLPSHAGHAPMRRHRGGLVILAVITAAAVLAFVLVSKVRTDSAAQERTPPAGTSERAGGTEVEALRGRLNELSTAHDEPPAPPSCQSHEPGLVEKLIEVASKLEQGAPGSKRAQDIDAMRLLSDPGAQAAEYWHWLAKARLYAGADTSSVLDAADRAITLCESYAAAYNVAGTARFRARNAEDAERLYRKAVALDQTFLTARYNLGLVELELGRVDEGIASFTRVLESTPDSADALVARGQAYLMARALEPAVRDLVRAAKVAPDSASAFWLLGIAYEQAGKAEEARSALCRAGELGHEQAASRCGAKKP